MGLWDFIESFPKKWYKFVDVFINQNGYVKVVEGLQNTLTIAVLGLLIGILIGTLIATVRVLPKYKFLPRFLNGLCSFYVGLFRGTPIVVQLLVGYYVLLPILGKEQWRIAQKKNEAMAARQADVEAATSIAFVVLSENSTIDDVTVAEHPAMFANWEVGISYGVSDTHNNCLAIVSFYFCSFFCWKND